MTTLSNDGESRLTRRDGGADPSAANLAAFGMTVSFGWSRECMHNESVMATFCRRIDERLFTSIIQICFWVPHHG